MRLAHFNIADIVPIWRLPKLIRIEGSELLLSNWVTEEHGSAPYLLLGRWPNGRHTFYTSEDEFIITPSYMDIHLLHALCSVIGPLWTSSHQLELEIVRYTCIPLEERMCQSCHHEWNWKNTICHGTVFHEIGGSCRCVFNQGVGLLSKVMEYRKLEPTILGTVLPQRTSQFSLTQSLMLHGSS